MFQSFLTVLPDVDLGPVTYRPCAIPDQPHTPPMVHITLGAVGSGLTLTVEDARTLFTGLGAALAVHDRTVAGLRVVLGKAVA